MEILFDMKTLIKNFIRCGILGWCLEILFTSLASLRRREPTLKGNTSLYMFPIYGMAAFLAPVCRFLRGKPLLLRGLIYAILLFGAEYVTGTVLDKKTLCPWDYSRCRWNVRRFIRLDFLPYWFITGLLFEKILLEKEP